MSRSDTSSRSMSVSSLRERIAAWRAEGLRVVMLSGAFDLPQAGHARQVAAARLRGDRVVVAVEDDSLAARTLGPGRPVSPGSDRAGVMAALRGVDAVALVGAPELERLSAELDLGGSTEQADALDRDRWRKLGGGMPR